MTAARLQQFASFLAGHDYNIENKSTTEHGNADALSQLPLEIIQPSAEEDIDAVDVFHMSQIELLPVTSDEIRQETQRDMELSWVLESVTQGWYPEAKQIQPYYNRKDELSAHCGCLAHE